MKTSNGWDKWYAQWNERFGEQDEAPSFVTHDQLELWGTRFRELVMLNDHWMGYQYPGPMTQEDGMSIAFVLVDSGVEVEELLELMDEFQPIEGSIVRVGIPLCWLTDPMDHVYDLLSMLADLPNLEPELIEQMQRTLTEMLGEETHNDEDIQDVFRTMSVNTVQWLLEMMEILSDNGRLALRAWWQGRLITLLREEEAATKRKRTGRRHKKNQPAVPRAFEDLIQGLDLRGMESVNPPDEDESE
ncbi:MAG TPA: hypothetical protein VFK30_11670 [Anaerolineae bacterium]|nr:hypothetical protein [Anaerolineae bacterium]